MSDAPLDAGLTTVDRLTAHRKLVAVKELALLAALGRAASIRVEQYCGRRFRVGSYVEAYSGAGRDRLMLRNAPVASVAWVKDASLTPNCEIPAYTGTGFGYLLDGSTLVAIGGRFPCGPASVVVQYDAGYAEIPDDIAQAVVDLVALKYELQDRVGTTSETVAGQTTAYFKGAMPADVVDVLNQYRRVAPV